MNQPEPTVPESAPREWGLACRDCPYEQYVDSLALANECRSVHETVRPGHNVWITAPRPVPETAALAFTSEAMNAAFPSRPAPPAEPVEEQQ